MKIWFQNRRTKWKKQDTLTKPDIATSQSSDVKHEDKSEDGHEDMKCNGSINGEGSYSSWDGSCIDEASHEDKDEDLHGPPTDMPILLKLSTLPSPPNLDGPT